MIRFLKSLYLHKRFFYAVTFLAASFLASFWIPGIYPYVWTVSIIFLLIFVSDCLALYRTSSFKAERSLPEKFSNSDENPVELELTNNDRFHVYAEIIDEIPVQFQKRDFLKKIEIPPGKKRKTHYYLKPVERGEYFFGKLNIFISTKIKLAKRRYSFQKDQMVKVYPSFIQMKKYDFLAMDSKIVQPGFKKIRRIGHTMEFEQIKEYVAGDDVRSINWKATAKQNGLMVNQFQDERSQPVYSVIDTGRAMKMPFNHLKLLDYAINSTLAFSNIAIKKKDKAGMLTFSNEVKHFVPAASKATHLNLIMENLYNINTEFSDSDFGLLYARTKRNLAQRSLLMLYTNFEHISGLQRQLPFLLALAKKHLLVVIFFQNTELETLMGTEASDLAGVYDQTIAEQFCYDKRLMAKELQKAGIQTILTRPEDLTMNTINKYLEIKNRGLL